MEGITVEEWLTELERLAQEGEQSAGLTSQEIVDQMGLPRIRVQEILRTGVRTGTIVMGFRTVEKDWDGRRRVYRVYRPRKAAQ